MPELDYIEPTLSPDSEDLYLAPAHGWTCFHCGLTLLTPGAARDHFGATPDRVPGCIIHAGEERGLLMAVRKLEAQRDELLKRCESAEMDADCAAGQKHDVLRLVPGARSSCDIRNELDFLRGRAEAAEGALRQVALMAPELFQSAMVASSGPGTYYPPSAGTPALN